MLSRKHYKAIASIIKDNTSQTEDNNTLIYDNIDRDNFINVMGASTNLAKLSDEELEQLCAKIKSG